MLEMFFFLRLNPVFVRLIVENSNGLVSDFIICKSGAANDYQLARFCPFEAIKVSLRYVILI